MRIPSREGFLLVKTYQETIDFLISYKVEELDLDYNLGPDTQMFGKTGESVLKFIKQLLLTDPKFVLPDLWVHSSNSQARARMEDQIDALNRLADLSFSERQKFYE